MVYNVMIYCDVRALTYYGWCGSSVMSWSVLRGEPTYSFDARTHDLTHIMLHIDTNSITIIILYN